MLFSRILFALACAAFSTSLPVRPEQFLIGSNFGIPTNATFDYVIVGGGTAGLTLAARLAKDHSVAVIEAGSFYELGNGNLSQIPLFDAYFIGKDPKYFNPSVDWGFITTPQVGALNQSSLYARGKTLGGCSARNYMAYHRGTKQTYDKWADQVGDASYSLENLQPFFEKSLKFTPPDVTKRGANATAAYDLSTLSEGDPGPLSVGFSNYAQAPSTWIEKGFSEIGISPLNGFTSGKLLGSSWVLGTINATTQTRESSETAFLQPELGRNYNLVVYVSTLGKRIIFDGSKTAKGVAVSTNGLEYVLSANKEVIVSSGAFQSPQLLMVSGVGPASTLAKHKIPLVANRSGVGQNLWDHAFMGISYRVNAVTASSLSDPQFLHESERQFRQEQRGILTSPGGDFLAFEKIPQKLRSKLPQSVRDDLAKFPEDWPELEYISMSGYLGDQQNYISGAPNDGYQYATVSTAILSPTSRGSIDIASSDMSDPPVINPNWLSHPTDQQVMIAGFKRVRELFKSKAVQPLLNGKEAYPGEQVQTDEQILALIRKSINTVYHAAATCAMGRKDDTMAVVDSKARVYGVKNLRVVDASAFPFLPPGHPQATVYALAEKIANDILNG